RGLPDTGHPDIRGTEGQAGRQYGDRAAHRPLRINESRENVRGAAGHIRYRGGFGTPPGSDLRRWGFPLGQRAGGVEAIRCETEGRFLQYRLQRGNTDGRGPVMGRNAPHPSSGTPEDRHSDDRWEPGRYRNNEKGGGTA